MAKPVKLSTGRMFPTVNAAKEHFAKILKCQELKQAFTGNEHEDVEAIFFAYCAKTDWALPSMPASFYPAYDRGPGFTTRCFGVTFEDGTTGNFSMDKALRSIAA
ncbi:MAG: hypothetical protein NTU84_10455 [Verrucomicrobia bacterium]|nr:hypothetical protein [Verrucomicrobiota bacterium]